MSTKPKKKVWKGDKRKGPPPARHIPWPEIFKHHISVIEGHTKMLEMIQKHTVPNTGNHTTITAMVRRSHEILHQAKDSSRSFIPPPNQRESVPLGSSSLSMYPGYSPADIEYGEASAAMGHSVGKMQAEGQKWELPADGPEYKIGQARGAKRTLVFRKDSGASVENGEPEKAADSTNEDPAADGGENPYFVIDTNPTPIKLGKKRSAEDESEPKKKKTKTGEEASIETEDISAEVEARLKAKEEKRRAKEEKKRRRSSTDDEEKVSKKPKKEKSKKREADEETEVSIDGEKRKKRKKNKDSE